MIICGIDPGIAIVGIGIIQKTGNQLLPLYYGSIQTPKQLSTSARLLAIHHSLQRIFTEHSVDQIGIESLFYNKNAKTAMAVSQARGVILLSAEMTGCPIMEYSPPQIKLAVSGYGKADKQQVHDMVQRLLKIKTPIKPDDVADALAVAICHAHSYRLQSYS